MSSYDDEEPVYSGRTGLPTRYTTAGRVAWILGIMAAAIAGLVVVGGVIRSLDEPSEAERMIAKAKAEAGRDEVERSWAQAEAERAAQARAVAQMIALTERPHSYQECHPLKKLAVAVRPRDKGYSSRFARYRACKEKVGYLEEAIAARAGVGIWLGDAGRLQITTNKPTPAQVRKVQKEIDKLNAELLPSQLPTVLVTDDMPPAEDWTKD
jgi:hypothetical protein